MGSTVIEALRRFLPEFLAGKPALSREQRCAVWAITHCRTQALGGRAFDCERCGHRHLAWHSCNHKACPQCGKQAAQGWVQREMGKLVHAPYFLVTFTLPAELRGQFFGPLAKQAYDMFFTAVSRALSERLAKDKTLRAQVSGFTAALHTWNQRMEFHPHIHCLVPGAGLNGRGKLVRVKQPGYLVHLPNLRIAFRRHMHLLLKENNWQVDPVVWRKDWGVHIQPAGSGTAAVKYLGAYVARSVISDARILAVGERSVTFRWQDRARGRTETLELTGVEFVRRYLRHVLPAGLRSVRYYGFCHPAAKANRMRVQLDAGMILDFGSTAARTAASDPNTYPRCPKCGGPCRPVPSRKRPQKTRGPPKRSGSKTSRRPRPSTSKTA